MLASSELPRKPVTVRFAGIAPQLWAGYAQAVSHKESVPIYRGEILTANSAKAIITAAFPKFRGARVELREVRLPEVRYDSWVFIPPLIPLPAAVFQHDQGSPGCVFFITAR